MSVEVIGLDEGISQERYVRITIWKDRRTHVVNYHQNEGLMDLLRRLGHFVDGVIVMKGRDPVPLDMPLDELEEITVIDVMSGG